MADAEKKMHCPWKFFNLKKVLTEKTLKIMCNKDFIMTILETET